MVVERIVNHDAELAVISYLADQMTATVSQKTPNPRPGVFVTVRRTGGPRREMVVDAAQLTIEAWAQSSHEASNLAQEARSHVHAMRGADLGGPIVCRVEELSGPAYLPDPTSDQDRYTFTVVAHIR